MKHTILSGDIFEVKLKDGKKYFQFVYKDEEYMAGHLIRVFNYTVEKDENPKPNEVIKQPILFYAYTRIIEGIKEGFWNKVGNISIEKDFDSPTFRQTNDTFSTTPKSKNWFIWKNKFSNKKFIGELTDEYKKLPFSSIFPPQAIVKWMETSNHEFLIPE